MNVQGSKPESYLITGAMGFVGSHLAESLLRQGKTVWGIDFAEPQYQDTLLKHENFHFVRDTMKNDEMLAKLIDKVDVVCHLAAIANPHAYVKDPYKVIDVTMKMGLRVMELAELKDKLMFFTSTSEIYGKNPAVPWHEGADRVIGPTDINRWCYTTSKAAVEHALIAAHERGYLDYVIVRLFNVYGPRLRGRVVNSFIEKAVAGEPLVIHGDGKQTRCFTYVQDAVDAFNRLITDPGAHNQVYNVGNDHESTILELAEAVAAAADKEVDIQFVPHSEAYGESYEDVPRRVPDITRLRETTGWTPTTSLADGVASTYDYEKNLFAGHTLKELKA